MKIQCNACGAAEARVLCCADEAALCVACDKEVHAANKLGGKHQRVPLLTDAAPAVPKCDICQTMNRTWKRQDSLGQRSATVAMEAPEEQQQHADLGALHCRHEWPAYGAWIQHA